MGSFRYARLVTRSPYHPRDRAGTFEPTVGKKRQRRLDGVDDKVLALYAHGMPTREIQHHLEAL